MATLTQLYVALQANTQGLSQAYPALQQLTNQLNVTQTAVANLAAATQQGMANIILAIGTAAQAQIAATNQIVAALQHNTTAQHTNTQAHQAHNAALVELIKGTQIYLGPLSGVASRIQNIGTLFREVTPIMAGLGLGFVSMVAILGKSIEEGARFERQFLRIQGALESSNNTMGITAAELNEIAEKVANTTLASLESSRAAAAALATFPNINKRIAESALLAAQGLSLIGRGDIESQIRRLGKILEDPVNNMNALSESGVKFDTTQKLIIKSLQESGDLFGAQSFVLERTAAAQGLATKESAGLVGIWDRLRKSSEELFAVIGKSGVVDALSIALGKLNAAMVGFSGSEEKGHLIGRALAAMISELESGVESTMTDIQNIMTGIRMVISVYEELEHKIAPTLRIRDQEKESIVGLSRELAEVGKAYAAAAAAAKAAEEAEHHHGTTLDESKARIADVVSKYAKFFQTNKEGADALKGFRAAIEQVTGSGGLAKLQELLGVSEQTLKEYGLTWEIVKGQIEAALVPFGLLERQLNFQVGMTGLAAQRAGLLGDAYFQAGVKEAQLLAIKKEFNAATFAEAQLILESGRASKIAASVAEEEENKRQRLLNTMIKEMDLRTGLANLQLGMTRGRAPEADIAVSLARAVEANRLLTDGTERTKEEFDRLVDSAGRLAAIKTTTDRENSIRLLEQELALQQKEISYFSLVESDRQMVAAYEKRRLDLVRQYGPLLNDQARLELSLYQEELKRAQLIKDLATVYNAIQTNVENVGVAVVAAASQGQSAFDALKKSGVQALLAIEAELVKIILMRPLLQGIGAALGLANPFGSTAAPAGVDASGAALVPVSHGGGVVGGLGTYRSVDPSVFIGAPRLHSGLASDEFPAILQRGETVTPKGGGGDRGVVINIAHPPGTQAASQRSQAGDTDIYDVVISNVAKGFSNKAFDGVLGGYGARRRTSLR